MLKCLNDKGFSVVEILLVVGLIALLVSLSFLGYRSFEKSLTLSTTANEIITALHLAADQTISSKGDMVYGVHFESDAYAIFSGLVYNASSTGNEVFAMPAAIEISDIALTGGGSEVIYNRLTGQTDTPGTVSLRVKLEPTKTRIVNVLSAGYAGEQSTVTTTGARLTDGRHTHFDLGWSIQDALDLELYFTDTPDVSEVINMSDYFNADQSEFDWMGTVAVNGSNQVLRIHTHSLDAFDTVLSINRDGRYNDKALNVSVDGQDIASFSAAGVPSAGVFGGTMMVQ